MKYKYLRSLIKSKDVKSDFTLKDCELVIDGKSYFGEMYKKSGCKYILGGECDRFASYLKNTLDPFIKSNVTCYVIFNGGMNADVERRKEIHQNVINSTDSIKPGEENVYIEPIFVKDVCKEVLEELGIQYFISEYDSRFDIFNVARKFSCPVLTNNYEYCFYGISCITPNLTFDKETESITCSITEAQTFKEVFISRNDLVPIFLSLVDEDSLHFKKLPEIIACRVTNLLPSVLRWVRRQNKDVALNTITKNLKETERAAFLKSYEDNVQLCKQNWKCLAIKYFQMKTTNKKILYDNCSEWFVRGVASGRIAVPYVNLKNNESFSGSWVIVDKTKEDAMLPTMDIVSYVYGLLNNTQTGKITFIGRKLDKSSIWEIDIDLKMAINNEALFESADERFRNRGRNAQKLNKRDLFQIFVESAMPGFNSELLQSVPEDCRLLIISLVYFCKLKKDFMFFAYSILLSYVMLGPVSEKVGLIKRSNFQLGHNAPDDEEKVKNGLTNKHCIAAASALMNLFYDDNLKSVFDRSILHSLAEFQHCLQHMNYLNKLCGEPISCTAYHKSFNGTFVYNAYLKTKGTDRPMKYFEDCLGDSQVLNYYKNLQNVFEDCLSSVK